MMIHPTVAEILARADIASRAIKEADQTFLERIPAKLMVALVNVAEALDHFRRAGGEIDHERHHIRIPDPPPPPQRRPMPPMAHPGVPIRLQPSAAMRPGMAELVNQQTGQRVAFDLPEPEDK